MAETKEVEHKVTMETGIKRPERGPYPKGVINGPYPTTKRGLRRRRQNIGL